MSAFATTYQTGAAARPYADAIYNTVFPGCTIRRLETPNGRDPHPLDQYYGIDLEIILPTGCLLTAQEKFRDHRFLGYMDFTQEVVNGDGTPGEWARLQADFYLYGWCNPGGKRLEKWALINVVEYKLIVAHAGGLAALGELHTNRQFGGASFYAIPITKLEPAFHADYRCVKIK